MRAGTGEINTYKILAGNDYVEGKVKPATSEQVHAGRQVMGYVWSQARQQQELVRYSTSELKQRYAESLCGREKDH